MTGTEGTALLKDGREKGRGDHQRWARREEVAEKIQKARRISLTELTENKGMCRKALSFQTHAVGPKGGLVLCCYL